MLKYRLWDNINNRYITDDNILLSKDGKLIFKDNSLLTSNDIIIEEFTGAIDIEGTEIFVGDIIKKLYITPMGNISSNDDYENEEYVIIKKYGCFGIETEIDFYPLKDFYDYHSGKYISNKGNKIIYDNMYIKVFGNIHKGIFNYDK